MSDRTIIYVSSNRESPEFERKTMETLLKNLGGLPIVSVTQKPMPDLGMNYCVGDVGASGFNFCRQVLIACEMATTPFVVSAESDCIYPPDYFTYTPEKLDVPYRNTNIYVQRHKEDYANKKDKSTFAQIVGREFYIKRLRSLFEGQSYWNTEMKNFPKEIGRQLFRKFEYFTSENPCVSFKTGLGMRNYSNVQEEKFYELPYWGSVKELNKYYGIN
jgi:hypothetical protein